jgi:tRNA(Arg) A34 adenosine deaminase TadA
MTPDDVRHLRRCLELAREARERGDDPFGALLVGPDGAVLAEHRNGTVTANDVTAHPELTLARWAAEHLSPAERAGSTTYTSCEHCAMCATAHFWAGVGRIVFAFSSEQLGEILPQDAPMLRLSTRDVFATANRPVVVEGPCLELADEARALFDGHWA